LGCALRTVLFRHATSSAGTAASPSEGQQTSSVRYKDGTGDSEIPVTRLFPPAAAAGLVQITQQNSCPDTKRHQPARTASSPRDAVAGVQKRGQKHQFRHSSREKQRFLAGTLFI